MGFNDRVQRWRTHNPCARRLDRIAARLASLVGTLFDYERHSSNTTSGSNFLFNDRGDSCRGRLLPGSHAERPSRLPCPVLGCFNGVPLVSRIACSQGSTDANACQRSSRWRRLLCCRNSFCRPACHMVFKCAHGQPGTSNGKASPQPNQDSKAAPRS